MNRERFSSLLRRAGLANLTVVVATTLLVACGGGGDAPAGSPVVTSATATGVGGRPVMYSQALLITVNGSSLDGGLSVTAAGCKAGPVLSSTPPYSSTATQAFYLCTVSAVGPDQSVNVARASDGASLKTVTYSVPVPQVTLTVKNRPLSTVDGQMVFTLAPDKTPLTVDNFLAYVNSGFYDGTLFHRVVPGFVVQGGGYIADPAGGPPIAQTPLRAPIPLEVGRGLSNTQWSIAMARVDGSADSATSQFFVNVVDNTAKLNPGGTSGDHLGYAVFGTLSTGTAVVSSILGTCTPPASSPECAPDPNVVITAALQTQ